MIYTSQYDEGLYDMDSFDRCLDDASLNKVLEDNDFSYLDDLDEIS